jgi:cell division protein FtsA
MDIAEKIKLKYGCAVVEDAAADQVFKVNRIGSSVDKEYNQVDLANIIEPRVQEIFQLILQEVRRLGYDDLPGGFVLTGGTVSMPGMLTVAQAELGSSVRIAVPDYIGVRDPSYTSGVGIIQYVSKHMRHRGQVAYTRKTSGKKMGSDTRQPSLFERFKNWMREFI